MIWSGIPITAPNEQGCQGDRDIGIMDEGRQSAHARTGEYHVVLPIYMKSQVERNDIKGERVYRVVRSLHRVVRFV